MNDGIKKYTDLITESNNEVEAVNEANTLNFNFHVLADFCRVRNHGGCYMNGPEPTPRVQFLVNLIRSLGMEPIVDTWQQAERRITSAESFSDIMGFEEDQIDEIVDGLKDISAAEKEEEKRVLTLAFNTYDTADLDELKATLRQLERTRNSSKAERRMYNLMIKFKTEAARAATTPASVNNFFNIYIKGSGNKAVMAHHDIVNPSSDNCNDNSASCINAIAAKVMNPSLNVIINDGEEVGGIGARRSAEKIRAGEFGAIEFVLNLELTAVGGRNFFVEEFASEKNSALYKRITTLFPGVDTYRTPFHDGIRLREAGIDSLVINPLPRKADGELKYDLLWLCHSNRDSISIANYQDMHDFVVHVVTPIVDGRPAEANLHVENFNAPLNEVICEVVNGMSSTKTQLMFIEENNEKIVVVKRIGFDDLVLEEEKFDLLACRTAYKKWKNLSAFGFSNNVTIDDFNNYTYF